MNDYVITKDGKFEHREIYKKYHGKINSGWVVHHLDENKSNNRIENLMALPSKLHTRLHVYQYKNNIKLSREEIEPILSNYVKHTKSGLKFKVKDKLKKKKRSNNRYCRIAIQIKNKQLARQAQDSGLAKEWLLKKNNAID